MLDCCRVGRSPIAVDQIIPKLNRCKLDAEWELITLYRLASVSKVEYESISGKRHPDIRLTTDAGETAICEIRTVSDGNFRGEDRIGNFEQEARRHVRKFGLPEDKFSYQIEAIRIGKVGNQKIQIGIPADIQAAFPKDFFSFLKRVKTHPGQNSGTWIRGDCIYYHVAYHPLSSYVGQAWSPFPGTIFSKTKNPLANALEEKRRYLRDATEDVPKGIILCDGGCRALSTSFVDYTNQTYSTEDVIWDFLRQTKSISFVQVQYTPVGDTRPGNRLHLTLYRNDQAKRLLTDGLIEVLQTIPHDMPPMMFAPYQARGLIRQGALGSDQSWFAASELHVNPEGEVKVKISARLLRDFLAGHIDESEFRRNSGNLLDGQLFEDKLILAASIEEEGDFEDDDYIVLVLGEDPSVKDFK